MPERNRVVVVSAPREAGLTAARRGEARGGDQGARRAGRWRRTSTPSTRGRCSSRCRRRARSRRPRRRDEFGITEWELSNGVKVVLKPTTFKQDEILFRAVSPGGTSLASDADFIAGQTADAGDRAQAASASSTRTICERC